MRAVGIHELKNKLSEYVRLVEAGESILVTHRRTVVAEMRPPGPTTQPAVADSGLAELMRRGRAVGGAPHDPELVASDLTLVECERVLIRAWSTGLLSEAERADQSAELARAAAHWVRLRVDDEVVQRTRRPFPIEPIRTLDALHLGSALAARSGVPGLRFLTLDQRIRENAERLGFETVP